MSTHGGDAGPGGDIAIIGMACVFPKAPDVPTLWQNILDRVDAVTDPPEGAGYDEVYDPESTSIDRIYCKKGGFLAELAEFNPFEFGILPKSVDSGESDHWLALRTARAALQDSGYLDRDLERKKVGVVIGKGTMCNRGFGIVYQHVVVVDQTLKIIKQLNPEMTEEDLQHLKKELKASLPALTADNLPALIPNLLSSRISNRMDLMGPSYIVDAACASTMIALDHGIRDLRSGRCDMALIGGVNTSQSPPVFMAFCGINALSPSGRIRPFDAGADGTLLGEGVGMLVIKRLEDAERDADRIYAVIKGVGTASDGKAMGLFAPRLEGEQLALRRAYELTGISPDSIGLIETHGTATPVGDVVEIEALNSIFGPADGERRIPIGSVKSMISHTIPAAGSASLIKMALALHHKIIPPSINFDEPNPECHFERTPFYVNVETRPWIHGGPEPRRAGVNAFGFGGINSHTILEEYVGDNTR